MRKCCFQLPHCIIYLDAPEPPGPPAGVELEVTETCISLKVAKPDSPNEIITHYKVKFNYHSTLNFFTNKARGFSYRTLVMYFLCTT